MSSALKDDLTHFFFSYFHQSDMMGQPGCLNSSTGGVKTSRCFVGLCFNKHLNEAQLGWITLRSSTEVWPLLKMHAIERFVLCSWLHHETFHKSQICKLFLIIGPNNWVLICSKLGFWLLLLFPNLLLDPPILLCSLWYIVPFEVKLL